MFVRVFVRSSVCFVLVFVRTSVCSYSCLFVLVLCSTVFVRSRCLFVLVFVGSSLKSVVSRTPRTIVTARSLPPESSQRSLSRCCNIYVKHGLTLQNVVRGLICICLSPLDQSDDNNCSSTRMSKNV